MKRYLFFVSVAYSYSILRPIQDEIRRRGGDAAWFIEKPCPIYLEEGEKHLKTIQEVMDYSPIAVFAPGNYIYDFIPGIKVKVFHGFDIDKRPGKGDHYSLKGWFDLYCTQGEADTAKFQSLSEKYKYFKVAKTGWSKIDSFFGEDGRLPQPHNQKPVVLYASTFTRWITSAPHLFDEIHRLIRIGDYDWLITLHPKMDDKIVALYKSLEQYENVIFYEGGNNVGLLQKADVMICDSSSIIVEFLFFNKPVVTFKNTSPGDYLIDIDTPDLLQESIKRALTYPPDLMENIKKHTSAMHPFRDGNSSARVIDAVDDFIENYKGKIKTKPLDLFRKFKLRKKAGYFPFGPRYKTT